MSDLNFFATTPKGLELLLVEELRQLGALDAAEKLAGVVFTGDLALAYKACMWSRLANRILLRLAEIPASTPEELYEGVQTISWDEHLDPSGTLNVNFVSSQSNITHTLYGAQKVKDAIVDQFREKYDVRPSVARENPDLAVQVYLHRNKAVINLDLSGESLHRRAYRLDQVTAPLKENLAAAILMRSNWKGMLESGGMFIDPMCGSGTLLIEAAWMAGNIAPGLMRDYFGFLRWKKHDPELWQHIVNDAKSCQTLEQIPEIVGFDADPYAIKAAFSNIERAGLLGKVHVEKRDLTMFAPYKADVTTGLIVTNPPYGERLGEIPELQKLYEQLGEKFKTHFAGWRAAVFTGNPELGKCMGLRSHKSYALYNGAIPCQLLLFDIQPEKFIDKSPAANNERRIRAAQKLMTDADRAEVQVFINRIQKKLKHLRKVAKRENLTAYRVYDADVPEYAVCIDIEDDTVRVQEYPAPRHVSRDKAQQRLESVLAVLPEVMDVPAAKIYFRCF